MTIELILLGGAPPI